MQKNADADWLHESPKCPKMNSFKGRNAQKLPKINRSQCRIGQKMTSLKEKENSEKTGGVKNNRIFFLKNAKIRKNRIEKWRKWHAKRGGIETTIPFAFLFFKKTPACTRENPSVHLNDRSPLQCLIHENPRLHPRFSDAEKRGCRLASRIKTRFNLKEAKGVCCLNSTPVVSIPPVPS